MERQQRETGAFTAVTTLFFAWGFITSLIDPLVAAVKGIFSLSDVEAQLSAFAFFIAYGLVSLPAARLTARSGPVRAIMIALGMMIAGCATMLAASNLAFYPLVLFGLFVLASGITMLQVAANPLSAALGSPDRSHFRLTLSQAFNSVGTFLGPYLGATLFLRGLDLQEESGVSAAARSQALVGIDRAYLWIAALIVLLLLFFAINQERIKRAVPVTPADDGSSDARKILSSRWALIGGAAIFLYVGAEVAIGTQMALFLHSDAIWGASRTPTDVPALAYFMQSDGKAGVSLQEAGRAVSLYWGGAMIGRVVGAGLLARFKAGWLLTIFAVIAAVACLFIWVHGGAAAGFVALAIGLLNSIMFPTIFTLTLERSTAGDQATSGFLCTMIVGGALLPLLVGVVSQATSYATAFVVPAACYLLIAVFAAATVRDRPNGRRGAGVGGIPMH